MDAVKEIEGGNWEVKSIEGKIRDIDPVAERSTATVGGKEFRVIHDQTSHSAGQTGADVIQKISMCEEAIGVQEVDLGLASVHVGYYNFQVPYVT